MAQRAAKQEAKKQDSELASLSLSTVLKMKSRLHLHPLSSYRQNSIATGERWEKDKREIDRRCGAFNEENVLEELSLLHEEWRPSISWERAKRLARISKMQDSYTDYLKGTLS